VTIYAKDPAEIIDLVFPYADEIGSAVISPNPVVTIAVVNGVDASAAQMLSGAPIVSGQDVVQRVINGIAGVDYQLRCVATLSDGRKLVRALTLPVRSA